MSHLTLSLSEWKNKKAKNVQIYLIPKDPLAHNSTRAIYDDANLANANTFAHIVLMSDSSPSHVYF